MRFHKAGSCVCLLLVLCVSSNCGALGLVKQSKHDAIKSDDTLYYLDIASPSISQPIDPANDQVEEAKFVQVEVSEILNPKRYALTFQVQYQPKNGARVYLGSFSPYPADNPGKFIVATQGKVKTEGAIVLTMVINDKVDAGDSVKAGIKRIKFAKGS